MNPRTYFEDIGAWPAGKSPHATWPAYVSGFILSLVLTFAAYRAATEPASLLTKMQIIGWLIGLAALQFIVQLSFFFHLSFERSARERLAILAATIAVVTIVLSGSIWILLTLDARMMPDAAHMTQYMNSQPGL
ncbi:MAG: cyoD [Parcubacteria group bacterium]|nr:cyoD [Parcubacteria group bacterium]